MHAELRSLLETSGAARHAQADPLRGLGAARAGSASRTGEGVGGPAFADLLQKARAGELSTGLPVREAPGAGLNLSPEQLERLATVTDAAKASGANRALVLMDGRALSLDVGVRTVTGALELSSPADAGALPRVLAGIDAVIVAPPAGEVGASAGGLNGTAGAEGMALRGLSAGATGASNASLLALLAEREAGADERRAA